MDRLSQNVEKIRELQDLQVADQWYQRYWSAYEAREASTNEDKKREIIRKNAPCFYVSPNNAAKYWFSVFVERKEESNFEDFCQNINQIFDDGCWCSTCLHLEVPGFFDRVKNAFDIPVYRKYIRKRGGPIKLSFNSLDPFVQEALNSYSSLQGNGICPHCHKKFDLIIPDTKNLPKSILCAECKNSINTEEAIRLCFS